MSYSLEDLILKTIYYHKNVTFWVFSGIGSLFTNTLLAKVDFCYIFVTRKEEYQAWHVNTWYEELKVWFWFWRYFSTIVKSRSNPFLEPTSTKQQG